MLETFNNFPSLFITLLFLFVIVFSFPLEELERLLNKLKIDKRIRFRHGKSANEEAVGAWE